MGYTKNTYFNFIYFLQKNENNSIFKSLIYLMELLKMNNLYEKMSEFVKITCADRDESHGWSHMKIVCDNSLVIFDELGINSSAIKDLVIIVSWLHDVNDYKYDHDGTLTDKIRTFLQSFNSPERTDFILDIIERISFSKEIKMMKECGSLDWLEVLGNDGLLVRDIVSDADKLEAIGEIGFDRCLQYGREKYFNKYKKEIQYDELVKQVFAHCDEKLLLLKDHYIKTEPGKKLAIPRHNKFVELLKTL